MLNNCKLQCRHYYSSLARPVRATRQLRVEKMRKFWGTVFIACLLCQLEGRSVCAQQTLSNWEEELGVDMCPECRPLPSLVQQSTSENFHEGDLGVDICPECRSLLSLAHQSTPGIFHEEDLGVEKCTECRSLPSLVHTSTPENFHEEDLGVDMCLECWPLPILVHQSTPEHFHEEDLGVDMCPECRPLPSLVHTLTPEKFHEEDLGVDMCPECRPLPSLVHTSTPEDFHEEDLGVDMCPEKGQPMSVGGNHAGRILATESNTLVKELQQLVKVQQMQIDQLGDLLQKLGKTRPGLDLGILDSFEEETSSSRDSNARSSDYEFSEHQHEDGVLSLNLAETRETQNSLGSIIDENTASTHGENGVLPVDGEGHSSGAGGMMVVPYRPSWSEHFSFLSAVKVDGEVSCLHVLAEDGDGGDTRYVVGVMNGELYIFLWRGDLLLHYRTISTAPVTAMLSYSLQKTETILVTGHADGGVLVHQIQDTIEQGSFSKDGRTKLSSIKTLHSLKPPSPWSFRANVEGRNNGDWGTEISMQGKDTSASVVNLEMLKVGKMRYTIVVDKSGKIQLFRDNGSLHGVAQSPSQPLAFMRNPNAQRLVFLTEKGVGTLDLRSMQVRSSLCVDLNTSVVVAYAFDAVGRSKASGFTAEGDLVFVVLRGDMLNFECHMKKKHQLEIPGPFAPLALKGYLVAATPDHVLVFNTSSQTGLSYANLWVAGPRLMFSVPMNEIALTFLKLPILQSHRSVMASNRDRFIVLGFGGGYVGVFRSNLPIKPADFSAKFSNTSILISAVVLLAMWQLLNRKKGPAAVVSSECPPMPASSTSAHGEAQSARLSLGEREKVVEPRRFKSPTRGYVVGNPIPFGNSSRSFTLSSVDSDSYISARKEPLFASNQPVGELEPRQ